MLKKDNEILKLLHHLLQQECKNYKCSYLFGSRIGNNYKPESDYDIVILLKEVDRDTRFDIYGLISDIAYRYDIFIDTKILTEEEFRFNPFFYEEVITKGICYGSREKNIH